MYQQYEMTLASEYEYVERLADEFVTEQDMEQGDTEEDVLCPICKLVALKKCGDVILCPKRDCLRLNLSSDTLGLNDLRNNLASVLSEHGLSCMSQPKFVVRDEFGMTALVCGCERCGQEFVVL